MHEPSAPSKPTRLRLWLGLSLAFNLALGAVVLRDRLPAGPAATPSPSPSWSLYGELVGTMPPAMPDFSKRRLEAVTPAHAYGGQAGPAFTGWREAGRAAFKRVLGYAPRPFPGEVRVTTHADFGTYTRERIYLKSSRGLWLPAYMCMPKGIRQPRPAVIALPGHDGPVERGAYWATGPYNWPGVELYMDAFGRRLAEAGYVVLALDVAGIGELRELGYDRLVNEGLLVDEPLKRVMLEQIHEAVDYMVSLPQVDQARLGVAGVSLGGELAMFAGLLDPRVAFVASSGFLTSYRETGGDEMASMYIPGVLKVADIPDLAAMVAPRPMWIQAGRNDPHFRIEDVRRHMETVRRAYAAAGAAEALSYHEHDRGHTMVVDALSAWLEQVAPLPPDAARPASAGGPAGIKSTAP